jgi:glyoxylase-like metal-dependent hydrolase (beta-lactamase superfamily II)
MNSLNSTVRARSRNRHATVASPRRGAGAAVALSLLLLTSGGVLSAAAAGTRRAAAGPAPSPRGAETAAPASAPPGSTDAAPGASTPDYSIRAIRYATVPGFPLEGLMVGAPKDARIDIAMVVWLVAGGGHAVLLDTGFHRERWFKDFDVKDFLRPDEAVAQAGVPADRVTDVVISHAHWDHMGGVDLFPKAQVWIQKQEYAYYTGDAWQPEGRHGGIDPEDVAVLLRLNTEGRLHLVGGDDVEILPGLRVYTGARHTFASQYLRVATSAGPFVLASDNCYLDRNLKEGVASATFSDADRPGNIAAQKRMIQLAGSADHVIPGHDPRQFERFPAEGRVARIH